MNTETDTSVLYERFGNDVLANLYTMKNLVDPEEADPNYFLGISDGKTEAQARLSQLHDEKSRASFEELILNISLVLDKPLLKTHRVIDGSALFRTAGNMGVLFIYPKTAWTPLKQTDGNRSKLISEVEKEGLHGSDLVWLVENESADPTTMLNSWRDLLSATGIRDVSIRDWFSSFFGEEEYQKLEQAIGVARMKCRFAMGYTTIGLPTEMELSRFRTTCIKRFQEQEADAIIERIGQLCNSISITAPLDAIKDRVLEKKRFLRLYGKSGCGESFTASEWRFSINDTVSGTEQTGTVAGYIKSVEQLMWEILGLYVDRGMKVKLGERGYWKPLTQKYLDKSQRFATLGNLMYLFAHKEYEEFNNMIFYNPDIAIALLWEKLNHFDKETRNGKFHKANFSDIELVKEIRSEVLDISFLILGFLKLDEQQEIRFKPSDARTGYLEESLKKMQHVFDELLDSCNKEEFSNISVFATRISGSSKYSIALSLGWEEKYPVINYYFDAFHFENDEAEAIKWLLENYSQTSRHSVFLKSYLKKFTLRAQSGSPRQIILRDAQDA